MIDSRSATGRAEQALRRAHDSQPRLNAFTEIDDEGALAHAVDIDRRSADGQALGPLSGVPVALKDLIDQRGHQTTAGSAFYAKTAHQSAPCVEALERAGAVIVGRTGLHEWAFGFSSENPHWGAVRNPWDTATSAGGSSGGSAAAVAAGVVPVAVGTDTGGSIRVPSALCGTFGLKVTHGRISVEGVFPLVPSIDTVGPIASSMAALEGCYRAMSGDDSPTRPIETLRVGIPQPWVDDAPTEAPVSAAFEGLAARLRSLGHEVGAIHMPDVVPSIELWHAIAPEVREVHAGFRSAGEPYGDDVAQRLDAAQLVTDEKIEVARSWQRMIRERFADALDTVDFLITPSVPVRRKVIGVDEIGGRHYRAVLSYFSAIVNHSLHPAAALPLVDDGGPPSSLQVIGRHGGETDLIGFGSYLEERGLVGFRPPPANSRKDGPE